jgi:glycerol-3-phosphate acyltransferase PlsX
MRIALDAMGGDFAPREVVRGAVDAVRGLSGISKVFLVGDESAVKRELDACGGASPKLEIRHASQAVGMEETPALAIRRKKDNSISRAMDLVHTGEADAFVSAGNTGAVVVAATLKLRTIEGVERPSIAMVLPTQERPFILTDAGANTDCSAHILAQFAAMGSVYSHVILGREKPVVGLLSIGGEESKGNDITKEAFRILQKSPLNFRGNVEGHDLFKGQTDVIVCDGFVGNAVLKASESASHAIAHWMKQEFRRTPLRMLGALLLSGALKAMKKKMDPEMYGGAPLLGVKGVCIIAHGASSARAMYHAIRVARESVHGHLNEAIASEIGRMGW